MALSDPMAKRPMDSLPDFAGMTGRGNDKKGKVAGMTKNGEGA